MTVASTSWTTHAACRGNTAAMFPDADDRPAVAAAKRVCAGCPVQVPCAVLARRERNGGVWAGKLREPRGRARNAA